MVAGAEKGPPGPGLLNEPDCLLAISPSGNLIIDFVIKIMRNPE